MSTQLVKLTIFLVRKEGTTEEEFHKYWSESHAKLFLSTAIVKKTLVKYTQYHASGPQTAGLSAMLNVVQWDGAAIFYARSIEDIVALFSDPEYISVVVPDELKFLERSKAQAMIGYEEVKLESQV